MALTQARAVQCSSTSKELKLPAGTTLRKAADLARAFAAKEHRDLKPYEAVKDWPAWR